MLYLKLYNGRYDPNQDMDDFGFEGPSIGPLESVHGTYTTHMMVVFSNLADAAKFGIDVNFPSIPFHEDMLRIQMPGEKEVFYGDWIVGYE